MSTYSGKPVTVNVAAHTIAEKFADLSTLSEKIDSLPDTERAGIGNVRFDRDAIIISNPMAGDIRLNVTERSPRLIRMECNSPIHIAFDARLTPVAGKESEATEIVTEINADLPAMLRPFIGPHLQNAADRISDMMVRISG